MAYWHTKKKYKNKKDLPYVPYSYTVLSHVHSCPSLHRALAVRQVPTATASSELQKCFIILEKKGFQK